MSKDVWSGEQWRPVHVMDSATTYRHRVPAHKLSTDITPNSDVFVTGPITAPTRTGGPTPM